MSADNARQLWLPRCRLRAPFSWLRGLGDEYPELKRPVALHFLLDGWRELIELLGKRLGSEEFHEWAFRSATSSSILSNTS